MTQRVVAVHRYFWPDTAPYASILRSIADRWAGSGAEVTVVTAQPSYRGTGTQDRRPARERLGELLVRRVPVVDEKRHARGQLVNLIGFPLSVGAALARGPRPDLIMCSTAPQVFLAAVASSVAKRRGVPFVYHCMDLHPEIGRLSGEFAHPVVYRLLMHLDTATMRRSAAVVVLSEDMRRSVLNRDPDLADRVVVINNFALPDFDEGGAQAPMAPPGPGTLRIVFTGNIGRFQRLEEVIGALAEVDADVELVLMGDGRARDSVAAAAAQQPANSRLTVRLLPQGSPAQARALMGTAHLGLVSLTPGVVRYAYPSKTATYLCEGLPVLAYCEADTELASTVAAGLGWSASDPASLAAAVASASEELRSDPVLASVRARVRSYAAEHFADAIALAHWEQLLDRVTKGATAHV